MGKRKRKEKEKKRAQKESAIASKWVFLNPSLFFEREASKADLRAAATRIYLAGIVFSLYFFLLGNAVSFSQQGFVLEAFTGLLVSLLLLVVSPIFHVAVSLVSGAGVFLCAKVFGGEGSFTTQFYLPSLYAFHFTVLGIFFLGVVPLFFSGGALESVRAFSDLLTTLLYVVVYVAAVKHAHGLSAWKAFAVVLASGLVLFLAFAAIASVFTPFIFGPQA